MEPEADARAASCNDIEVEPKAAEETVLPDDVGRERVDALTFDLVMGAFHDDVSHRAA